MSIRLPFAFARDRAKHSDDYKKIEKYDAFVHHSVEIDKARAQSWAEQLLACRDPTSWSDFVSLKVMVESMVPSIQRELLVTPHITMAVSEGRRKGKH